jgi:hypothetical protein
MGNCWFRFLEIKSSGRILINNATDDSINQVQILGSMQTNIRRVWWVINRISYGGWIGDLLVAEPLLV